MQMAKLIVKAGDLDNVLGETSSGPSNGFQANIREGHRNRAPFNASQTRYTTQPGEVDFVDPSAGSKYFLQ